MISGLRQAAISPLAPVCAIGGLRFLLLLSAAFFIAPGAARAQQAPDLPLPRSNMGTIGLIDMPSARMADDGTISVGASFLKDTQRYNLGFQILPWLEGSFRYSGLSHFNPDYPVYWDRSFGLKLRLLEEGDVTPALAIGVNDIVGTGIYGGEYLVMSKQFGDFDASLGMGWGRLGSVNTFANPLRSISSSLGKDREAGTFTPGGTIFGTLFHGRNVGLFGGVSWRTPLDGLVLNAEYSSDAYRFEAQQGGLHPRNQMNYGLSYQLSEGIQVNLGYLYGNTLSGSLAFSLDPSRPQYPTRIGEAVPAPVIRSQEAQRDALRNLVGQRDTGYVVNRVRTENRNAFVDQLLALRGAGDVLVTGHTLTLTLAGGGNSQALCRAAANTAASSGTGLSDVAVRTSSGSTVARCAVPRQVQATMHFADLTRTDALALDGLQPVVIDATDVQPPADRRAAERKFRADMRKQGIELKALSFTDSEAIVYYANYHYRQEADAIERIARLLMQDAPTSIEKFRLISVRAGVPQREFNLLRAPMERALNDDSGNASVFDSPVTIESAPMSNPLLRTQTRKDYPHFDWDIFPQFRQQFFDPTNPLGVQMVGVLQASVDLAPGLTIWGQGEANIFDTFTTARQSDSVLPHVRTDFVRYFSEGKNGLGALQANYRTRLAPDFYATLKAGYLESMFAGAGGEVLWRPDGARWAIGADIYEVQQRNFDRLFGLQPYRVTTGHVTFYWDSPFWDLNFQARAGQYLAGDRGVTLQITRRFSTGVEIGAFFTKTNVSAERFGEGSFDKGIFIRIPLDWIAPINTQNMVGLDLRPVQRDGGQAMLGDATLYEETRATSEAELVRSGKNFAD